MIVYTPIFYCAELKLAFKGKLTWKVADTLHMHIWYDDCKHAFLALKKALVQPPVLAYPT